MAIVDLRIGRTVAVLQFRTGVEELFAVEVLPNCRCPILSGVSPEDDGGKEIWVVPPPSAEPRTEQIPRNLSAEAIERAARLLEQGNCSEAIALLTSAIVADPNDAALHNDLGNAYQQAGDQQTALTCYRNAVASQPDYAPAHQNLGYLLANRIWRRNTTKRHNELNRLRSTACWHR